MYEAPSNIAVFGTPRSCYDSNDQTIALTTVNGIQYPFSINLTSDMNPSLFERYIILD